MRRLLPLLLLTGCLDFDHFLRLPPSDSGVPEDLLLIDAAAFPPSDSGVPEDLLLIDATAFPIDAASSPPDLAPKPIGSITFASPNTMTLSQCQSISALTSGYFDKIGNHRGLAVACQGAKPGNQIMDEGVVIAMVTSAPQVHPVQIAQTSRISGTHSINYPLEIAAGRLDSDNYPDLALGTRWNLQGLKGNGDGTFAAPTIIAQNNNAYELVTSSPAQGNPVLAVGDFNGAGIDDIAMAALLPGSIPGLMLRVDTSITTFKLAGTVWNRMILANFDGPHVALLMATVAPQHSLGVMIKNQNLLEEIFGYNAPGENQDAAAADFNGDGKTDLVWGYNTTTDMGEPEGSFILSFNQGAGIFSPNQIFPTKAKGKRVGFRRLATADFNSDGKIDLAVYTYNGGYVLVYPNTGDYTNGGKNIFASDPLVFPVAWQSSGASMVTDDLDQDGRPDIVLSFPNSLLIALINETP